MKKLRLLSLATASLFILNSSRAATFDDIQFWAGSGANRAALVIDWNDGKSAESLVWGYRWNGPASGADMLTAIINADPRLFAHLGTFNFGSGAEPGIFGLGYDLNANGIFGVSSSPSLSFDANGLAVDSLATGDDNVDAAGTPSEAADHWLESWWPSPGYWAYYNKPSAENAWSYASSGVAGRALTDGAWDGLSFAPDFMLDTEPSAPVIAAVPEPTALALCFLGGGILLFRRNRTAQLI